MAPLLPVALLGDNLSQRHRHLNCLVREAKENGAPFQDVEAQPEESAVDRLFKIDLATELKYVDYILSNLKDDDMLYVSRALKSTWLIGHHDIINPKYLDDVLFPEMITPAVTKMKHWLYINLRDPAKCQDFYQHHKENTFEFALKFLSHCSHEFILAEAPKILTKLSTHSLKVLCEKCPTVAKIYFDSLATDEDVKTRYLGQDRSYYNSVKCVLKSDADVFLDITEKYFNIHSFSRFSHLATDYILHSHKTRFTDKVELYVAYILHIPTLAARLSVEECQEVILKLARASYLQQWFEYKVVEPLIKRLSPDKRAAFKKLVFVDKDIGDCEDKWPYEIPAPPTSPDIGLHIFDDQDFMSTFSPIYPVQPCGLMGFSACTTMPCAMPQALNYMNMVPVKTDLDRLFDEFRFIGFERALHELGQRLVATGSTDRRRDIFLVLVSKTGGRTDAVSALLRLAARYSNEPAHTRASILRSLVKRANVWRLPADVWQHLLDYGHGLGLDGTPPEAACREGLHAVVIRQLLAGECEQAVRVAFMEDFSTLLEYSLKVDERVRVAKGLQTMLTDATIDVEPGVAAERLHQLLNVLKIYRVRVEPTSPAVKAVVALASRDAAAARPLLERLYNERIARRELLRLNMEFRRDEAALLNALRHDPAVFELEGLADILGRWHCWQSNFRRIPPCPPVFGSFSAYGRSSAQPLVFGNSTDPPPAPTSFSFGSSAAQPSVEGNSAAPSTGFHFDSSAAQPLVEGNSAAPPTGFRFDSSTAQPLVEGNSAAPPTGFRFDSSTALPLVEGNSAAPPTGFRFDSSTAQPLVEGNSAAPPTGFRFDSSTAQPLVEGNSAAPPTAFRFDSSAAQPSVEGNSAAPLTVFRFDNSAAQPSVEGNSAAPPTAFRFDNSAAQPLVEGNSAAPQMGFSFGSSAAPSTVFGFDSSATQSTVGSPTAQPTVGCSSAYHPLVCGSSTDQPTVDASSTNQLLVFGSSTDQPFVDGGSTIQPTAFGSSAAHPMAFGSSAAQPTAFGSFAAQPMAFGRSVVQPMAFGTSAVQPMAFGSSTDPPVSYRPPPFRSKRYRLYGARQTNFDRFTSKLVIYFDQKQDLTTHIHTTLKERVAQGQNIKLARPLASLFRKGFEKELCYFDAVGKESMKFAAALRACAHRARPVVNLAEWGWSKAGVKAVATRAMRCREIERAALTRALAAERRTVRVALALSMRSAGGLFLETLASTAKLRPAAALRAAMPYFRRHGVSSDLRVWDIVKPLFSSVNLIPRERLCRLLGNTEWVPSAIKPDFCITLYLALHNISSYHAQMVLRDLSKLLPDCDESMESILLQMLDDDADKDIKDISYPTIFVRYLLLSRSEEDVERRFVKIGNRFLERLDTLRSESYHFFQRAVNPTLESLKYNSAFLDLKFPSCLPVIERILAWLKKFMPKEEFFCNNTQVHLTMLYFKAVRQSMKQMPEVFADQKRRKSEGVEVVGFNFGRYIANDVVELVNTYFDSIIELYTDALGRYLNSNLMYGNSRNIFNGFVLKGILTEAVGIQRRVAVYVLREHEIGIDDSVRKEIEELIMKDRAIEIIAHAELCQYARVVPYRYKNW